jgi:hypothetical protein
MFHDPCNPLPSSAIPGGLPLRPRHVAVPGPGPAKPNPPQSHAIVAVAPSYLGCDHKQTNHARVKSVQAPPPIELPAVNIPRASAIAVATLPSAYPPLQSFSEAPGGELQLPMPEPSSAIMFLFAIFVAWGSRRLDLQRLRLPRLFTLNMTPPARARHRHRSKSIACYSAFQQPAP